MGELKYKITNQICFSDDIVKNYNLETKEILPAKNVNLQNDLDLNCNESEDDVNHSADIQMNENADSILSLDIKYLNFENLKIDGPNFRELYDELNNIHDPSLNTYQRIVYHYANIYIKPPEWNMVQCIRCVMNDLRITSYTDRDICQIVAEAHNVALRNYNGNDMACNEFYDVYGVYLALLWY